MQLTAPSAVEAAAVVAGEGTVDNDILRMAVENAFQPDEIGVTEVVVVAVQVAAFVLEPTVELVEVVEQVDHSHQQNEVDNVEEVAAAQGDAELHALVPFPVQSFHVALAEVVSEAVVDVWGPLEWRGYAPTSSPVSCFETKSEPFAESFQAPLQATFSAQTKEKMSEQILH
jgi:hypothetical protein